MVAPTVFPARRKRSGFTLIEMSVVLVVVALLIGGIMVGKSLIHTSKMRSVISQYRAYSNAVAQFKEQYSYLPGDLPTATDYWGTDPGGCPNPAYDGVKKKETCNGNGDGHIATYVSPTFADFNELYRAWQQLSNAGLIEGQYVGASSVVFGALQTSIVGENVPGSRITDAGWSFYPLQDAYAVYPSYYWNNDYDTTLFFGKSYSFSTIGTALSGPDAFSIDKKVDDGRPGYGKVSTLVDTGPSYTCLTSTTRTTAEYIIEDEEVRCMLIFKFN